MDRNKTEFSTEGKSPTKSGEPAVSTREANSSLEYSSRTAELFRQGKDLYESGDYQQAIHVWTRILFLDRGNLEVRGWIDRAKRARAERHRELDACAAAAVSRFEGGDVEGARAKLRYVLSVDPGHAEARGLAERIASSPVRHGASNGPGESELDGIGESSRPRRGLLLRVSGRGARRGESGPTPSPLKMAVFVLSSILLFAVGALYLHLNWDSIVSDGAFVRSGAAEANLVEGRSLPIPGPNELLYYNGARLFAKGRYREALRELGRIDRSAAVSREARSLVLRIEERLLRGAGRTRAAEEKTEP